MQNWPCSGLFCAIHIGFTEAPSSNGVDSFIKATSYGENPSKSAGELVMILSTCRIWGELTLSDPDCA